MSVNCHVKRENSIVYCGAVGCYKGPLKKAFVTENLCYSGVKDIHSYLKKLFEGDDKTTLSFK